MEECQLSNKKEYPVFKNVKDVQKYMETKVGSGVSYDVDHRDIYILKTEVQLYYLNGMVDDAIVTQVLRELVEINDYENNQKKVGAIVENRLITQSLDIAVNMDEAIDQVLSLLIIFYVDGEKKAFI